MFRVSILFGGTLFSSFSITFALKGYLSAGPLLRYSPSMLLSSKSVFFRKLAVAAGVAGVGISPNSWCFICQKNRKALIDDSRYGVKISLEHTDNRQGNRGEKNFKEAILLDSIVKNRDPKRNETPSKEEQ